VLSVAFESPAERAARLAQVISLYVDVRKALRVLDIGCGTGDLLFTLAQRLPCATLVGVDIAPANIAVANARLRQAPQGDRLSFLEAD
jgi:tRNA1(Val) A37 N6-methylase TrmN6